MLSYLLCLPTAYSSHDFVPLNTDIAFRSLQQKLHEFVNPGDASIQDKRRPYEVKLEARQYLRVLDYKLRPEKLEKFSLYFFMSACDACKGRSPNTSSGKK